MKHQALFSSKDKSKNNKRSSAAVSLGTLRVNIFSIAGPHVARSSKTPPKKFPQSSNQPMFLSHCANSVLFIHTKIGNHINEMRN